MNDQREASGLFLRELGPMLDAGKPLLTSLKALASKRRHASMRTTIEQIAAEVETGSRLSTALAAHPTVFDQDYVGVLRVFEDAALRACRA